MDTSAWIDAQLPRVTPIGTRGIRWDGFGEYCRQRDLLPEKVKTHLFYAVGANSAYDEKIDGLMMYAQVSRKALLHAFVSYRRWNGDRTDEDVLKTLEWLNRAREDQEVQDRFEGDVAGLAELRREIETSRYVPIDRRLRDDQPVMFPSPPTFEERTVERIQHLVHAVALMQSNFDKEIAERDQIVKQLRDKVEDLQCDLHLLHGDYEDEYDKVLDATIELGTAVPELWRNRVHQKTKTVYGFSDELDEMHPDMKAAWEAI